MATENLTNNKISTTYGGVLHLQGKPINTDNAAALQYVYDGLGTKSGLQLGKAGKGIQVDGAMSTNGLLISKGINSDGEISSTLSTSYGQARYVANDYGVIQRNDGSNFYTLITSSGDPYGVWNGYRPFTINLATGNVTMRTQLYVVPPGGSGGTRATGWGGGVTSLSLYADGGYVGTGPAGTGIPSAWLSSSGYIEGDIIKARTRFVGPQLPKAWVQFPSWIPNAGGTFPTGGGYTKITSSFNVSGVFRYGPGNYRVEFSTPMPNLDYMVIGSGSQQNPNAGNVSVTEFFTNGYGSVTNITGSDNKTLNSVQITSLDTDVGGRAGVDGMISLVVYGTEGAGTGSPPPPVYNLTGSVIAFPESESKYKNKNNGRVSITVNLANAGLLNGFYTIRVNLGSSTAVKSVALGNTNVVFEFTNLNNRSYSLTVSDENSGFSKVCPDAVVSYGGSTNSYNF